MILPTTTEYNYIVDVILTHTLNRFQHVLHNGLKYCRSILQAKGHPHETELTQRATKGSKLAGLLFHLYLMEARGEVKLGKNRARPHLVQDFPQRRKPEPPQWSHSIQHPIVHAQPD